MLGELVLDADSVVVPTGGGAWAPVRRRRQSDREESEEPQFRVEDYEPGSWDERQPFLISSSEIAVPLLRGGPRSSPGSGQLTQREERL